MVLHADADEQRVLQIYLGQQQYDDIRAMGMQTRGLPAAKPRGNVVVLHGIMGGELTQFDGNDKSHIWLSIFHLLDGAIRSPHGKRRRTSAPRRAGERHPVPAITPSRSCGSAGNGMYNHSSLTGASTSANRQTRSFRASTNGLAPTLRCNLVAHSMGGLVSRSYILRHPDRWNKGGQAGHAGHAELRLLCHSASPVRGQ